MEDLFIVAGAAFVASMVDGALGMGFGPTSATILLGAGIGPAATSAMVNIAKVATGLAAAVSHWRFGNIDRRLVADLAGPGMLGASIGTVVLTQVEPHHLRPALAMLLLAVGVRILVRFSRLLPPAGIEAESADHGGRTVPGAQIAGIAGGVTNGLVGAWGPVVTPYLLHRGVRPRYAVGSVNTAEVAVAVVSVGSLTTSTGGAAIDVRLVVAMLVGGVAAAPLAARLVRHVPARILGVAVGGLLLSTQLRELGRLDVVPGGIAAQSLVAIATVAAACRPTMTSRNGDGWCLSAGPRSRDRRPAPAPDGAARR